MSERVRESRLLHWNTSTVPRCFPSDQDWREWLAARADARSPCEDCSRAYQRRMLAAGRCERPEALFVDTAEGELGISADDRRYARLLMGLSITGAVRQEAVKPTPRILALIHRARRYAAPDVKRAIVTFVRRARGNHDNAQ